MLVNSLVCDVTDMMTLIYARSAAYFVSCVTDSEPHRRLGHHGSERVKSDTAVYTADGFSLVQRSPRL